MKKTLKKIIDYAVGIAEPEMIILFGSMANGEINSFSDVDILIVSENNSTKRDIIARISSYSNELSLKADVLVYSRLEIERETQKAGSFIKAIVKSGKIVYKNPKKLDIF